jgi:hypothetical protein
MRLRRSAEAGRCKADTDGALGPNRHTSFFSGPIARRIHPCAGDPHWLVRCRQAARPGRSMQLVTTHEDLAAHDGFSTLTAMRKHCCCPSSRCPMCSSTRRTRPANQPVSHGVRRCGPVYLPGCLPMCRRACLPLAQVVGTTIPPQAVDWDRIFLMCLRLLRPRLDMFGCC